MLTCIIEIQSAGWLVYTFIKARPHY